MVTQLGVPGLTCWIDNSTLPTPQQGIAEPSAIVSGKGGLISLNSVNNVRSQLIWEVAPESTNHAAELGPNSALAPTSQRLCLAGLFELEVLPLKFGDLDGFFETHFVPSGILNQSGQLVRMWV